MLVLLSGVSGAGKDTIKKELIKRMENVESLPSYTDRAPRVNDIPGVTYNFVSTDEFERMIKDGELYEYSVHHEHYYGTSKKLLNDKISNGKIIVGLECNYPSFNWTETSENNYTYKINGKSKEFAEGYDVEIAYLLAKSLDMTLEFEKMEWDALLSWANL